MKRTTKDVLMYALAGLIVMGFFCLLYILLFRPIAVDNKEILNIVVGALIGSFTTIIGYFFGSSQGSAAKQDMISNIKDMGGLKNGQ